MTKSANFMEIPICLANEVAQEDDAAADYHVSKSLECASLIIMVISYAQYSRDTVANLCDENDHV